MGFGIVLILLGVIGAQQWVSQKVAAAQPVIAKLYENREVVGAIGIISGIFWIFDAFMMLMHMGHDAIYVLLALIGSLLSLGLGLIFGYDFLLKGQTSPPPFVTKVGQVRAYITPYQEQMSLAGIGIGALYFLIVLI